MNGQETAAAITEMELEIDKKADDCKRNLRYVLLSIECIGMCVCLFSTIAFACKIATSNELSDNTLMKFGFVIGIFACCGVPLLMVEKIQRRLKKIESKFIECSECEKLYKCVFAKFKLLSKEEHTIWCIKTLIFMIIIIIFLIFDKNVIGSVMILWFVSHISEIITVLSMKFRAVIFTP